MKYMRWDDDQLKWMFYTPPQATVATKAREARTDLYIEARDEALSLWATGWITKCECRDILRVLYNQRYLTVVRPSNPQQAQQYGV
jgi:hypothetical protein